MIEFTDVNGDAAPRAGKRNEVRPSSRWYSGEGPGVRVRKYIANSPANSEVNVPACDRLTPPEVQATSPDNDFNP